MKNLRSVTVGLIAAAAFAAGVAWNRETTAQPPPPPAPREEAVEEGVQVLTRGPVHEAFAEAVSFDPQPGVIVPQQPPDPIEESPPEQRPSGANVAWIPGYWAWDDERNDFLWVSGTWRALPPGRQWVSGYWGQAREGFQWISGYWADAAANEIEYLPEPPATVEAGPNIAATSADESWIPGCWIWQQGRYAWRPGYWAAAHRDWTWIPAHYVWAPRGYVFVDGYWDYSVARRGVLFAPVYFRSRVYTQRSYSYSPRTAISLSALASHLFVRPSYQHYYFGDYYGANYATAGYYPSFNYHSSHSGYDPIYAQQRWQNRQDNDWERRTQAEHQRRHEQEAARPPRTWEDQQERMRHEDSRNERSFAVGESPEQWTAGAENSPRFQSLTNEERRDLALRWQAARKFATERQKWETDATGTEAAPRVPAADPRNPARVPIEPKRAPTDQERLPTDAQRAPEPARIPTDPSRGRYDPSRVPFPRSPYVAKPIQELGQDEAPPRAYQPPPADPKVVPQPRQSRGQGQPLNRDPRLERLQQQPTPERRDNAAAKPQSNPRADSTPPPKAERQPASQKGGKNPKAKQPK